MHCRNLWMLGHLTCHIIWCCTYIQDLQDACHLQNPASNGEGGGLGGFFVLQLNGFVKLSCLSLASWVSSTTERFLLGDCPITTGNRSSVSFITLSASLYQPGCQILQSRWRRNLIAFSESRHSWGRFLKSYQSITQTKSSPDRMAFYIQRFSGRCRAFLWKYTDVTEKICSVRFKRSLLHQLIWRHIKMVVVCVYSCECIRSQWTVFYAITTCFLYHLTTPFEQCV